MKISKINNDSYNVQRMQVKNNASNCISLSTADKLSLASIPSDKIKANFLPSFGKRTTQIIQIEERNTGQKVPLKMIRETMGDFVFYAIYTMNKKEAAFMKINLERQVPENNYLVPEPENVLPKILELRTIMGDKYKGIGTKLVLEAMKDSFAHGKGGCLWLHSQKGFGRMMSDYRKNENPIPFYYKLGFEAVDSNVDKHIKECLQYGLIDSLPNDAILILTSDVAKEKLNELNDK